MSFRTSLAVASLTLLSSSSAWAADVVVFGDSWAAGAADELQGVLNANCTGLTVDPRGIGGTTAQQWANDFPDALKLAVAANPDARWVWLSIGGNDLFANYAAGNGSNNKTLYEANLRKMLTTLWATFPAIEVVMFAYDFVAFERTDGQQATCAAQAALSFGASWTTLGINTAFLDEIHATQAKLATEYPRLTYVPIVGTLQAQAGVANAPDVTKPSPQQFMGDCIHATSPGYTHIMNALYAGYSGWRSLPECSGSGSGGASNGGASNGGASNGGANTGGANTGGVSGGGAGGASNGGASGGGPGGVGGSSNSGASGGMTATGGSSTSSGGAGSGASGSSTGGTAGTAGGHGGTTGAQSAPGEDGSCSCRTSSSSNTPGWLFLSLGAILGLMGRRRSGSGTSSRRC